MKCERVSLAAQLEASTPKKNMCEETPLDFPKAPVWDHEALAKLRRELHSSRGDFFHLLDEEEIHPAFDPIHVRDLLREQHALGQDPKVLLLGRIEIASFRHFITRGYGEESGAPMPQLFFLGIPVVEDPAPSRLEFSEDDGFSSNDPRGHRAA